MGSRIRLAIGTPSTGDVKIAFMESTMHTVVTLLHDKNLKVDDITFLYHCSSVIPKNRQWIIKRAKQWGATHILWIDDDMQFPPLAVQALIKAWHVEKLPIIGVNCIKRQYPIEYMGVHFDGTEVTPEGKEGLEKVLFVGNALVLMDMKMFDVIPEPWFAFPWNEETKDFGTEDVFFMARAAKHGFDTYVYHDISYLVNHCGDWIFKPEHKELAKGIRGQQDPPPKVQEGTS